MILKVNQVLHHEKSKYQDVLVFESSDHGMVLVLDNVIQCTERDEFSYVHILSSLGRAYNGHQVKNAPRIDADSAIGIKR